MISPSNTYTGLTRTPTGGDPGELVELYPTGVRNFVRLAATDLQAAAAMAEAARQLGVKRLAILWDGEDSDMAAFAQDVRAAAASRDVAVSSFAPWDPFAERFDELARQVAAARADGVILAGAAPPHVQALLRELRDSLESDAKLLAHDGFAGVSPADAEGLYVENYGVPNAELPPAGRQLLAELEARSGDAGPDLGAAYGAQAAELLLDAIARSDGTRRLGLRAAPSRLGDGRAARRRPLRRARRPGPGARDHLPHDRRGARGRTGRHGAVRGGDASARRRIASASQP